MKTLVFLLVCISTISAQAPGDEDERCTANDTSYDATVKTLMDSFNYVNLLSSGDNPAIMNTVWNEFSFDGRDQINYPKPTYWQQKGGIMCRPEVHVCGWRQNGTVTHQNNWLFTQHIHLDSYPSVPHLVAVYVEVVFSMPNCSAQDRCRPSFNLLFYGSSEAQLPTTVGRGFMNIRNYRKFAEPRAQSPLLTYTTTHEFVLPRSVSGFYLSIQDIGSCVVLSRMRVYHRNCRSFQSGLVLYPDVPAPSSRSVSVAFDCVENAVVSGSPRVTCTSDGTWSPENPVCQCRPGYVQNTNECIACPAGEYRSAEETSCQQCPNNTETTLEAAPLCHCLSGYFRNNENRFTSTGSRIYTTKPIEYASSPCTKPPSAPSSVSVTAGQTTLTVRWSPPAEDGGRTDLYYQVEYNDPDNLGTYTGSVYLGQISRAYTFAGVRPFTQYIVRVTAHNGVSDQDPLGAHLRTVEKCTRTLSAAPGVVTGVQGTYPYVVWSPPERPNGKITSYTLTFIRTQSSTARTVTTRSGDSFYVIQPSDLPWTSGSFAVTVRARNAAGFGSPSVIYRLNFDSTPSPLLSCPAASVGLVRYPTTIAPYVGSVTVTTQCADNAHRTGSDMTVSCTSSGSWSGQTPECECDTGYHAVTQDLKVICRAVPVTVCEAESVGLVRYPTTLAPVSGTVDVYAHCADNAHSISGLRVICTSSGGWSGPTPECECDEGYVINIDSEIHKCEALACPDYVVCEAESEGLVHYPTTLAPVSGSVTVTTQCADNAHRTSPSLIVECTSIGSWSGDNPQCECDTGYEAITDDNNHNRKFCTALPVTFCEADSIGLVRYPTTPAPVQGSVVTYAECADNSHRTSSSLSIECTSDGTWSGQAPECECNIDYTAVRDSETGRELCEAIERGVCEGISLGLTRYPTTFAPVSGSVTVTTQCADNAHSSSSSLSVECTSTGGWSGLTPLCECDRGYHAVDDENHSGKQTCEAVPVALCEAKSEGLVHYPAIMAPVSGSVTVTTQCTQNSHDTSDLSVTCESGGVWAGPIPVCQCDSGYHVVMDANLGKEVCEALPAAVCVAMTVGLVHYPTTLAPVSGSVDITTQCADNAHRTSSSMSVICTSSGVWSGQEPLCECHEGYHEITNEDGRLFCQAVPVTVCEAESVGLVRYLTTLAPVSGSVDVYAHCADNAHSISGLRVICTSSGGWSGPTPECECDEGYYRTIQDDKETCRAMECPDRVLCERMSNCLVRYPATLAPVSNVVVLTAECADNAHRTSSSLSLTCSHNGQWSSDSPQCECDSGYQEVYINGRSVCKAHPVTVCEAKTEDLVRYPTTLAPVSGSLPVAVHCADNAHRITSLSVTCTSSGSWVGVTPNCECDTGYHAAHINDQMICQAVECSDCDLCSAKTEGLIRYPTTLAPVSGSVTVTTQCADNAHGTSSSLNVRCNHDGSWSGPTPQCECDAEYNAVNSSRGLLCQVSNIRCPTLQDPTDGSVQYSSVNIGTVAEYSCSEGLKLVGESIRVCLSDGSWSGEMPHCQEEYCAVELDSAIEVFGNSANFSFHGLGPGISSFTCKLDGALLTNCSSPLTGLGAGLHRLRVIPEGCSVNQGRTFRFTV